MKNFILVFSVLLFQLNTSAQSIIEDYLVVKDALVSSKMDLATAGAKNLSKSIQSLDANSLAPEEKKLFAQQKPNLLKLSESIAIAKDIEKQRVEFAKLSVILWPIVKGSAKSDQLLFYDYCPMKKFYWISADEAIKNPYYGSKMLSCGSISGKSNK
jgi:hypothetical protein